MIAFEMKGMDPKYTWENISFYRDPYEDMRAIYGMIWYGKVWYDMIYDMI